MIVIIDNYDSFTYNLVHRIGELGLDRPVKVVRNDAFTLGELASWSPTHIVISPGPCTPNESGLSVQVIHRFAEMVPILGVCLGHQCIGAAFGAPTVRASRLMHGKTSPIYHDGLAIYAGVPNPFTATRYHSLVVEESALPDEFLITARTDQNELMGIRHRRLPLEGVQYHPESFLTPEGPQLLANFLKTAVN